MTSSAVGTSGRPTAFARYRALIANPLSVSDDWFYRGILRLPGSHVAWAFALSIALPGVTELLREVAAPIEHVRSTTELRTPYFFAPVILVQVLLMPVLFAAALECFDRLRPSMRLAAGEIAAHRRRIAAPSAALQRRIVVGGLLAITIIQQISSSRWSRFVQGDWNALDVWLAFAATATLTMFVWYFTLAVSRAFALARAVGATVQPRLFDEDVGEPIVAFGVRAGLMFAIPYFVVDLGSSLFVDQHLVTYVPAVAGILATSTFIVVPGSQLRARIRQAKQAELARLDALLAEDGQAVLEAPQRDMARIPDALVVLSYRREVGAVREWPIKAPALRAFALYFLLVPLTWVAGALVELVLERAAG